MSMQSTKIEGTQIAKKIWQLVTLIMCLNLILFSLYFRLEAMLSVCLPL